MNKDKYEELLRRFSQELYDIGIPDEVLQLLKDTLERTPNLVSCEKSQAVDRFQYRHNGFLIEAERTVRILVKKCK